MKRVSIFILVCSIALSLYACGRPATDPSSAAKNTTSPTENQNTQITSRDTIAHVGDIPAALTDIIAQNTFSDIIYSNGSLFKVITVGNTPNRQTASQKIQLLDLYGHELASYDLEFNTDYSVQALTSTSDGGFSFVLGFSDHYDNEKQQWASENGFASIVYKVDKNGTLQFKTSFEGIEGRALEHCLEVDKKLYFFGTIETPETAHLGVSSPSDICMTVLDLDGNVTATNCIGGSDFDSLDNVELYDDGFLLSICAQSDDGDFAGSNSGGYGVNWVVLVNKELAVSEKRIESGRNWNDSVIGEKNDQLIYPSDTLFENFDAGNPHLYIEYGDFYLVVSERSTGVFERTPPTISSIWCYTETVYSGYSNDGELLFRTSVDSSPDYDAILQDLQI